MPIDDLTSFFPLIPIPKKNFCMKNLMFLAAVVFLFSCQPDKEPPAPEPEVFQMAGIRSSHPALPSVYFTYNDLSSLNAFRIGDMEYQVVSEDDQLMLRGMNATNGHLHLSLNLYAEQNRLASAAGWRHFEEGEKTPASYEFFYHSDGRLAEVISGEGQTVTSHLYTYEGDMLTRIVTSKNGVFDSEIRLEYYPDLDDKTGRDAWKVLGLSAFFYGQPFTKLVSRVRTVNADEQEVQMDFFYEFNPRGYPTTATVAHSELGNVSMTYEY